MIQIKSRLSGEIIHQGDFKTVKECVEDAVKKGISLAGANLRGADLINADLSGANLGSANLIDVNLIGANLSGANLSGANLGSANLIGANLSGANLGSASLINAYLSRANLDSAKMPDKPVILPPIGEAIVGFKKLRHGVVIKVEIPADADRVSTWKNRKCRASALRVTELTRNPRKIPADRMRGLYDRNFIYKLGELHHPDHFDPDERDDCLPGLHFFMTLGEAEKWT